MLLLVNVVLGLESCMLDDVLTCVGEDNGLTGRLVAHTLGWVGFGELLDLLELLLGEVDGWESARGQQREVLMYDYV